MESLIQDFRYATRQLVKSPGFTLVAVVTLALGIGANTAVFSLANWVMLRPVPGVQDAERVVSVGFQDSRYSGLSYPALMDLEKGLTAVRSVTGVMKGWDVPVSVAEEAPRPERVSFVTGNYFEALGVKAVFGRTLDSTDERAGQAAAAVISDRFWRERLHSDPRVIGTTVHVLKGDVVVVGIAPPGFRGIDHLVPADLWMAPGGRAVLSGEGVSTEGPQLDRRYVFFVEAFGRLVPGATLEQADVQVRSVFARMTATYPKTDALWTRVPLVMRTGVGVPIAAREKVASTLALLGGIAALVLVIAGANFANLLLFRGIRRRGQTGVRIALGASRGRLIRESVTESVLLAGAATAIALLFAVWLVGLFRGLSFGGLVAIDEVHLDHRVMLFSAVSALVVGALCGLVSPMGLGRRDLSSTLKDTAGKGSTRRAGIRGGMVVVQLSASLALLVVAGLFVTTLRNLRAVDVGFDDRRTYAFGFAPSRLRLGYSGERDAMLMQALRTRIGSIPGVEQVSFSFVAPFSGDGIGNSAKSEFLDPGAASVRVTDTWVTPGYFATLGIPLLKGRDFAESEYQTPAGRPSDVVIISGELARQLFGSRDPVGQYLTSLRYEAGRFADHPYRVVGVAADTRWQRLVGADGSGALLYHVLGEGPTAAGQASGVSILVRSSLPAPRLRPLVESAIRTEAPDIPLSESSALSERIDRTLSEQRLLARTIALLTLLAVVLAGIGLYGLVGFSVAERTREFGIRVALGAQAQQILNMVVREGTRLAVTGLLLGLGGALVLARLIGSRLFGVTPLEPFIYIFAMALLALITLVASIMPARAATRVDPMVALRSE